MLTQITKLLFSICGTKLFRKRKNGRAKQTHFTKGKKSLIRFNRIIYPKVNSPKKTKLADRPH